MWRSEDNSEELDLSFYLYMGSKNQTQILRVVQQMPLPMGPAQQSSFIGSIFILDILQMSS